MIKCDIQGISLQKAFWKVQSVLACQRLMSCLLLDVSIKLSCHRHGLKGKTTAKNKDLDLDKSKVCVGAN